MYGLVISPRMAPCQGPSFSLTVVSGRIASAAAWSSMTPMPGRRANPQLHATRLHAELVPFAVGAPLIRAPLAGVARRAPGGRPTAEPSADAGPAAPQAPP
jgi:hypothetical protein